MITEAKSRLETYAREQLTNTGKFSKEEIDKVVEKLLSLNFLKSEESINAFIKASQ